MFKSVVTGSIQAANVEYADRRMDTEVSMFKSIITGSIRAANVKYVDRRMDAEMNMFKSAKKFRFRLKEYCCLLRVRGGCKAERSTWYTFSMLGSKKKKKTI